MSVFKCIITQGIIYKTSTWYVHQQNSYTKQLSYVLLKKYSQYNLKHIYQIPSGSL